MSKFNIINRNDLEKSITFTFENKLYKIESDNIILEDLEDIINSNVNQVIINNDRFMKFKVNNYSILRIDDYNNDDLKKYSKKDKIIIEETPEDYLNMIKKKEFPIKWIKNIFEGYAEENNILLNEKDFILLKDLKFNIIDNLYLLAIFRDVNLKSIRSLRKEHIKMLNLTKNKIIEFIEEKYKINKNKLIFYFHYHPRFWQLHLHIQHIDSKIGKKDIYNAEKLDDVIYNLNLSSEYYLNKTMVISL